MKRRRFFKVFAALGATAVVAPSVLAKLKPDEELITDSLSWSEPLTQGDFDTFLNDLTRHIPGDDHMIFVGRDFHDKLRAHYGRKIQVGEAHPLGVEITKIRTEYGEWPVITSPYMEKDKIVFMKTGPPPFLQLLSSRDLTKPVKPKIEWLKKDITPKW